MSKDRILDSLGRIDDEVIQKVNQARTTQKPKPQVRRWAVLAACFALMISMALTAEATNGTVSNLLAPLFGGAQTEIVDKIGVPIGASTTVNGYTLTADAIIGDRYNVAIVYTLSRDDGEPIPDDAYFKEWQTDILGAASGGGLLCPVRDDEDPNIIHFVESWNRHAPIIGRIVNVSFSDLSIYNKDEDIMLSEGTWELTFTLRYDDSSEKLPVKNLYATDKGGCYYKVEKILLSPVGLHLNLILYDPVFGQAPLMDFEVSLLLQDGRILPLEGGGGGGMREGDKTMKVSYSSMFDVPVPRDDIQAIIICDTTYELENAK